MQKGYPKRVSLLYYSKQRQRRDSKATVPQTTSEAGFEGDRAELREAKTVLRTVFRESVDDVLASLTPQ